MYGQRNDSSQANKAYTQSQNYSSLGTTIANMVQYDLNVNMYICRYIYIYIHNHTYIHILYHHILYHILKPPKSGSKHHPAAFIEDHDIQLTTENHVSHLSHLAVSSHGWELSCPKWVCSIGPYIYI